VIRAMKHVDRVVVCDDGSRDLTGAMSLCHGIRVCEGVPGISCARAFVYLIGAHNCARLLFVFQKWGIFVNVPIPKTVKNWLK